MAALVISIPLQMKFQYITQHSVSSEPVAISDDDGLLDILPLAINTIFAMLVARKSLLLGRPVVSRSSSVWTVINVHIGIIPAVLK